MAIKPLHDIRVLDLTNVLAGPFACHQLAHMGADVIKVETRGTGDLARQLGADTELNRAHMGVSFLAQNPGKRSITLNLKVPDGIAALKRLIATADVVVENFRPDVKFRLGIDYETLSATQPGLIYASISGFGQTGPLAHRPAYDIIVQAMSGLMEATGEPGGAPTLVGEAVSDVVAGLFASWATLAALLQAQRTGEGQHVDVAMFDTTLTFLATSMSRFLFTGQPARRVGNRHPLSAPFGVYKARDGHYALAVLNKKLFDATARAMSLPELVDDPRYATDETRSANEPALRASLESWSTQHDVAEVVAALEAAGVPAAPIWNIEQALNSEQIRARGLLSDVQDERLPGLQLPTQPVHFNGSAPNRVQKAPALGEHTDQLLQSWLGRSTEAIAALRAAGALG